MKKQSYKHDYGKRMAGCLSDFSNALNAIADVFTFGANKYKRRSWQTINNGIERYTDAKWRHLLAGKGNDDESGIPHMAHEAWNTLAVLELKIRNKGEQR